MPFTQSIQLRVDEAKYSCNQATDAKGTIKQEQVSESDDDAPLRPLKSRSLRPLASRTIEPSAEESEAAEAKEGEDEQCELS